MSGSTCPIAHNESPQLHGCAEATGLGSIISACWAQVGPKRGAVFQATAVRIAVLCHDTRAFEFCTGGIPTTGSYSEDVQGLLFGLLSVQTRIKLRVGDSGPALRA